MKRIFYHIVLCCSALTALAACDKEMEPAPIPSGDDAIVLDVSSASLPLTRADATGAEVAIEHIDVLIFDATDQLLKSYERVTSIPNQTGKFALAAKRSDFDANAGYWVYLVANSTHTADEFEALADLNALKAMTQSDTYLHLTGITNIESVKVPQSFLMDGVAYPASETVEPASAPVVLNDGVASHNTELKAVLRRAAAKIVVHIKEGGEVSFIESGSAYYLRNLPYSTSVVAGVDAEADLRTTSKIVTDYFVWTENEITVTAYAYAHEWADDSSFEKDVRMVVNVPLSYDGKNHTDSYYQIPVSRDKVLARNMCYEVTVTVNAPGAVDPSEPPTLTGVKYEVQPWEGTTVNVGGGDNSPIYLTVNEEEVEMHNITDDNTTLRFASSSAVTVTVNSVYYYDKFGVKTNESKDIVKATPDAGLTGNIDIHSPLPTNNAIRYIELTVKNADGATPRKVIVEQYPLEYITNTLGWYSYRSDFGGTTYENKASSRYVSASWSFGAWNYSTLVPSWGYAPFFTSKVALSTESSGRSNLYYYSYSKNSNTPSTSSYRTAGDGGNARMYHVRITASSGEYTIGRPRITNGVTDSGADNAELVSPSFMIASQLGAVQPTEYKNVAASHCEQYVEVYKDENGKTVHLDDWRLPTKAELNIIMNFQYSSDAMDEVLAGAWYWSASGSVENPDGSDGSADNAYIRCIRDAY